MPVASFSKCNLHKCCIIAWGRDVLVNVHVFAFQIDLCFPEEGLVYDYRLDDAGISNLGDDDEDEERKVTK